MTVFPVTSTTATLPGYDRDVSQVRPTARSSNLLADSRFPLVYPIAAGAPSLPDRNGYDTAARAAVRSLTVMQKEAVVARTGSPAAWRLASDEGPYLQGHDEAPAPLAFLTTGFAVDVLASVERMLQRAGHDPDAVEVGLDAHFTIEGSLPEGTMVGGALPPEISVSTGLDATATDGAVLTGVMASLSAGLLGPSLQSLFSLTSDGRMVPLAGVPALDEPPPDPGVTAFPSVEAGGLDEPIVAKTFDVGEETTDAGTSLHREQRRRLHLHADAHRRHDGIIVTTTQVHRPTGSTFRFLAAEPPDGRAPDAVTYISAGIGFCFMTQLGRYAKILRRDLGPYRIVQDTRFSGGDPDAEPPVGGRAAAPETHVYLDTGGDDELARHALAMGEQTCFVHALCRTELRPKVRVLAP
jgi:hypothetical protein